MPFIVVSGLSGSGKSTVLRTLEDAGFFTTDNLPPELWGAMHDLATARGLERVAISTDARTRDFLGALESSYERLSRRREDLRVLFLEATADVLLKRYNLTRREHPLGDSLLVDFARERELLAPLRSIADTVIDTTDLSAGELAERVLKLYRLERDFHLRLVSFGFKHSPPRDVDMVLDVRSLPNPYYDPALRPRTGLDSNVADYVFQNEDAEAFYADLRDFVRTAAERARAAGRHGYTVGIGCTGGQHRSVAVTERLAADLKALNVEVGDHRDMKLEAS
ncbi:glmZ(sRNA)-inactivating NTPase [Deinococcus radiopugnans]|uniref:GlmZ(SRNA)-inactivating NTPase n=1 Tax=Deinococcus radiopugnans TaxID=57497 RepID=A0A0A7KGK9_9DEIO|nr:RNase adapter RapZ [Deinococcus radiopugnans]AIZ44334.1 glmZ(sRNA)-inactivating NTPase [Deinococcus radiopugnans]